MTIPASPPAASTIGADEPLAGALQRIGLDQYDRLIDAVAGDDPDVGVHTARKATKRLRSVIRLAPHDDAYAPLRSHEPTLRDAARRLARARDAHVVLSTLHRLTEVGDGAAEGLADYLLDRKATVYREVLGGGRLQILVDELGRSRDRLAEWDAAAVTVSSSPFPLIAPGLRRSYRTGRRRLSEAEQADTVEAFHEWRKPVKRLRYQIEALDLAVLDPTRHRGVEQRIADLDRLGELLGDDHDVAVLKFVVRAWDGVDRETRARLLGRIVRVEHDFQRAACDLGRPLFEDEPDVFVDQIVALWDGAPTR